MRRAASGAPVNWLAPPVSTTRRPEPAREARAREAVAQEFQRLLDSRPDDADEMRFWHMNGAFAVFADVAESDGFALVRRRGYRRAVEGLQALGVGEAGVADRALCPS